MNRRKLTNKNGSGRFPEIITVLNRHWDNDLNAFVRWSNDLEWIPVYPPPKWIKVRIPGKLVARRAFLKGFVTIGDYLQGVVFEVVGQKIRVIVLID